VSRSRTLIIFTALLVLAATLAACGGGGSDDPQQVVDDATLQGIESGDLDLTLGIDVKGGDGGHVDVKASGPFQGETELDLPELDLSVSAKGDVGDEKVDFEAGLTLVGEKAYVGYGGTEYAVDPTTFGFVKATLQEGGAEGGSSEAAACQDAVGELNVGDFIESPTEEGTADVDGTSTTKVSGNLDAAGALDAVTELTEDPACKEQLEAAGPLASTKELEEARSTVEDSVKDAHVELYVGDDDIIRRLVVQATIDPPKGATGDKEAESAAIDLDLTLSGVNEEQSITAPQGTKPLSKLFLKLGVNPIELLSLLEGQTGSGGLNGLLEQLGGVGSTQ